MKNKKQYKGQRINGFYLGLSICSWIVFSRFFNELGGILFMFLGMILTKFSFEDVYK